VERGPEVLCLEGIDLPAGLDAVAIDPSIMPTQDQDAVRLTCRVLARKDGGWPYRPAAGNDDRNDGLDRVELPMRPYHQWAERGATTMRVWLPVHDSAGPRNSRGTP
jgi:hypothetical protein